jgi:hypothetical protein
MDGLSIFEDMARKSGREGGFFPDKEAVRKVEDILPEWKGSREMEPERFSLHQTRELAAMAQKEGWFVEQEVLLAACREKGLELKELGI